MSIPVSGIIMLFFDVFQLFSAVSWKRFNMALTSEKPHEYHDFRYLVFECLH